MEDTEELDTYEDVQQKINSCSKPSSTNGEFSIFDIPSSPLLNMYCDATEIFFDCNALDEMGNRIDELEQSINDLKTEMGAESSSPLAKPKPVDSTPEDEDGSA
ncbi:hypothetical protein GIB67_034553 [Kingdonia uniflora]|uniref:Uncharacterized protein n=1 Tax=Kingdonia uniflora TaxID=39325 RepID=A0A7J7PB70_9MAGN|nr:hypothetical protein GIB67_034553 [Kingdonia uniflora]